MTMHNNILAVFVSHYPIPYPNVIELLRDTADYVQIGESVLKSTGRYL